MNLAAFILIPLLISMNSPSVFAETKEIKIGDSAPLFSLHDQDGKIFNLAKQKKHWTILYFYPKAGTPGCTTEACAFRDDIKLIQNQGAQVYGISADTVAEQKEFHTKHKLNFSLLADPEAKVIGLYGTKIPMMNKSKRWTFILGPDLKIKSIEKDVDPALDAKWVANELKKLKMK